MPWPRERTAADLQPHPLQLVKKPSCVLLWGLHKIVVELSGCGTELEEFEASETRHS